MALVPHKVVALNELNEGEKNTIAGAVVSLFDTEGNTVTLFDDESGANGSTAKQTDSEGVVVVYVTQGEYDEQVNGGIQRRVLVGNKEITTEQLIERIRKARDGDVITTTGFYTAGDAGGAQWKATSTTGLTPSQTPADRGAAELVDGSGRLWAISLSGYITPDMLGAVGDGVTDDTNVLQAAVNSAGKYPVLIPQKRYAITTLNIKDRDIIGLGSDSELVQIGSASYLITSSGSRAATTALTSDAAIHSDTVSVADSSIFSVGDYAVLSDELEYNPLDASYKNGEMHRIKSVDTGSVTFEYEIMGGIGETDYTTANASRLVLAKPQQSPKIKNLKISGDVSSSTAIVLFDVCKSPTVEGVTFNNGGHYGVRFNSCIDGSIKDSLFEGFLDTPGHVGYCVMASNATNGLHVTGNTFGECRHAFTTVGGSDGFPANIIIEGNTAKGTLQAAYDTHVSGKHIIIYGNASYNSKGSGINCRSPHTEIINNEIVAPATHGVSMSETLNYNVKIEGNTITRAGQLGIAASVLANDVSIKNNIIYKSGLDGIRYGSSISQINIIGNEITEVGQESTNRWGIACVGSTGSPVDDSVIKGNVIRASSENVGYGIINTITKSIITNNELLGTYSSSPISAISTSVIKNNTGYELSGYTRDSGVPLDTLGVLSRTVSNPIGLDFDESRVSLTVLSSSTNSFQLGWIRVLSVTASEITYAVNITEAEAGGTMDVGISIQD